MWISSHRIEVLIFASNRGLISPHEIKSEFYPINEMIDFTASNADGEMYPRKKFEIHPMKKKVNFMGHE